MPIAPTASDPLFAGPTAAVTPNPVPTTVEASAAPPATPNGVAPATTAASAPIAPAATPPDPIAPTTIPTFAASDCENNTQSPHSHESDDFSYRAFTTWFNPGESSRHSSMFAYSALEGRQLNCK